MSKKGLHPRGRTMIITQSPQAVQRLFSLYETLSPGLQKPKSLAALGNNSQVRKELKQLSAKPQIIVTTTERLIDHIRRKNLKTSAYQTVVILEPLDSKSSGFDKDIEFILSKNRGKQQIVIFTEELAHSSQEIHNFMRRPVMVHRNDWEERNVQHLIYRGLADRAESLAAVIASRKMQQNCILCSDKNNAQRILRALQSSTIPVEIYRTGNRTDSSLNILDREFGSLVFPFNPDPGQFQQQFQHIIYYDFIPDAQTYRANLSLLEGFSEAPISSVLFEDGTNHSGIKQLKEKTDMSFSEDTLPSNEEAMKGHLENLIQKIREADPEDLHAYKKLIKKHVPIFLRAYVGAYLLREKYGDKGFSSGKDKRKRAPEAGKKSAPPSPSGRSSDSSQMSSLFMGVGKNRKVYPKDITELITGTGKAEDSDIGEIKILDNYSFVEVNTGKAKGVIDALNGVTFRGRKLNVNFARKRKSRR
ncbi:MAG: DbpA RNA binding domain-containing protein [Spirochaetales bacterium]|nr:DbpA RNA binding domain-containing protein [Spirochaetales bacterium]MCF7938138.1 DbpA RNA binding domain-containing protein [Spirochaetales bacterium]